MRSDFDQPLNIGQDRMFGINQLADMVAEIAGVPIVKNHVPGPQGVRGRPFQYPGGIGFWVGGRRFRTMKAYAALTHGLKSACA